MVLYEDQVAGFSASSEKSAVLFDSLVLERRRAGPVEAGTGDR